MFSVSLLQHYSARRRTDVFGQNSEGADLEVYKGKRTEGICNLA